MNALAAAGIYLALDVNTPKYSLNQLEPADSYNHVYLQNIFATIDEFVRFENTLLFFSGNEVINSIPTSDAAPYVKAVTRDMKQYIGNRQYRKVPVGYSAADIGTSIVSGALSKKGLIVAQMTTASKLQSIWTAARMTSGAISSHSTTTAGAILPALPDQHGRRRWMLLATIPYLSCKYHCWILGFQMLIVVSQPVRIRLY